MVRCRVWECTWLRRWRRRVRNLGAGERRRALRSSRVRSSPASASGTRSPSAASWPSASASPRAGPTPSPFAALPASSSGPSLDHNKMRNAVSMLVDWYNQTWMNAEKMLGNCVFWFLNNKSCFFSSPVQIKLTLVFCLFKLPLHAIFLLLFQHNHIVQILQIVFICTRGQDVFPSWEVRGNNPKEEQSSGWNRSLEHYTAYALQQWPAPTCYLTCRPALYELPGPTWVGLSQLHR